MKRLVHCKKEAYDIYIGRPSKWGNPFPLKKGATLEERVECISKHKEWLAEQLDLLQAIRDGELSNKVLGCWCYPKPCHGSNLIELDELPSFLLDEMIDELKSKGLENG